MHPHFFLVRAHDVDTLVRLAIVSTPLSITVLKCAALSGACLAEQLALKGIVPKAPSHVGFLEDVGAVGALDTHEVGALVLNGDIVSGTG